MRPKSGSCILDPQYLYASMRFTYIPVSRHHIPPYTIHHVENQTLESKWIPHTGQDKQDPLVQWTSEFCFPCPAFNSTFLLGKLERTSVLYHLSWKTCSRELCPKDKQTWTHWTHTCPTAKGPLLLRIITAGHYLGPIMLAVCCWNYISGPSCLEPILLGFLG